MSDGMHAAEINFEMEYPDIKSAQLKITCAYSKELEDKSIIDINAPVYKNKAEQKSAEVHKICFDRSLQRVATWKPDMYSENGGRVIGVRHQCKLYCQQLLHLWFSWCLHHFLNHILFYSFAVCACR